MPAGSKRRRCDDCSGEDRKADVWARERGVELPHPIDEGRICGERAPDLEVRTRVAEGLLSTRELRDHLGWLEAELEARAFRWRSEKAQTEILAMQADVLSRTLAGESGTEIAALYGRASHSWTAERLAEIRAGALERMLSSKPIVVICGLAGCGRPVLKLTRAGLARKYCCERCRLIAKHRRMRARRGRQWGAGKRLLRRLRARQTGADMGADSNARGETSGRHAPCHESVSFLDSVGPRPPVSEAH